jgi:tRNA (cmo5U34)-methyltransferase
MKNKRSSDRERFQEIKAHFEKEAIVFDRLFFKVAPHYEEMMDAVVAALPFRKDSRIRMIDLGCGTGNFTRKLIAAFPLAQVTCVDMAGNMLAMAKAKLGKNPRVTFWQSDVRDFDYSEKFDVIVSSLVFHHIEKRGKTAFFRKLRKALTSKGVLFTIDIFLSSDPHLQALYMENWKAFMKKNGLPLSRVSEMISRHQREDRPVVFEDELTMVRKAGFREVEVLLKYYNFAVYCGMK